MTGMPVETDYTPRGWIVDGEIRYESPAAHDDRRADIREQIGDFLGSLGYEFDYDEVHHFLRWVSGDDLTADDLSQICGYRTDTDEPLGHDWQPWHADLRCADCGVIHGRVVDDPAGWMACEKDLDGTPMSHRWAAFAHPDYHFGHCLNCGAQGPRPATTASEAA